MPEEKRNSLDLTLDYQTLQKTQRQQNFDLLHQLSSISAATREVRKQKRVLFEQWQSHSEKIIIYSQEWQALSTEEITLLQEFCAILTQLASLREQG